MRGRKWFQTDSIWVSFSAVLLIVAIIVHLWVEINGGYQPGLYWDMITHFLFGTAICALLLNFNLKRSWRKLLPIVPSVLLVILPAIIYTVAIGFAWELYEEAIEHFLPWVAVYADFWWNGVRDLIMDFLGAAVVALIYLHHFPTFNQLDAKAAKISKLRIPRIPGHSTLHHCDNCGSVIPPDATHCPNCGTEL